jgi:hypothetical protein
MNFQIRSCKEAHGYVVIWVLIIQPNKYRLSLGKLATFHVNLSAKPVRRDVVRGMLKDLLKEDPGGIIIAIAELFYSRIESRDVSILQPHMNEGDNQQNDHT